MNMMHIFCIIFSCIASELEPAFDPYEPLGAMATGEIMGGGLLEPELRGDNLSPGAVSWNHMWKFKQNSYRNMKNNVINPCKPSAPFLGHRQTVQAQIRRHRTWRLISAFTVC